MKLIVIGNGMAGYKFCEKLVNRATGQFEITVFGEEQRPAYDRVHLSDFFSGKTAEDLSLASAAWYAENGIALHLGDPVIRINREARTVHSFRGLTEHYDILVFATGSAAFVPPIPGIEKAGVFIYRTIEDLEMMGEYAKQVKKAAVIGGGLLGLEAAKALLDLGVRDTAVIEYSARLMPRQIDDAGASILSRKLADLGLRIYTNTHTSAVLGEECITGLQFTNGEKLETEMLVISAGIRPRDELAADSGLETGSRGGIAVNDLLQTSDPCVYAIGECALHQNMIYGLVAPGYEMAEVLVSNLCGHASGQKYFTGFDMSTKLKLVGTDVASFGDPFISGNGIHSLILNDTLKGIYKRINISADGKQLLGGILVGDASSYNMLSQTCKNKLVLSPNPEELILPQFTGREKPGHGLSSLPDDALICSCEGITKGAICRAVTEDGCENVEAVKKCTKAGTGCGGCVPMIKDLMLATMKSEGKYVRNVICEHFSYSRQELFDLIKIHNLKNYNDVLNALGKGDGCEICKPAIASVLASLWNELILKKGNDTSQDSNDRFLANIQKGGTYSVVPRVPGGEIKPEKLIVIGQVAQKYGLYTKITGAQRIDMFGAHLSDLPAIWIDLIDAGFESGHAYGKALRTVKSCVGSTWCRFGLHDSVSFAIRIEERYRGLRAPHKLKSAVSGCVRECAEAQSKDFGIIATEKGWNLYVCGNGGS